MTEDRRRSCHGVVSSNQVGSPVTMLRTPAVSRHDSRVCWARLEVAKRSDVTRRCLSECVKYMACVWAYLKMLTMIDQELNIEEVKRCWKERQFK